MTLYGLQFFIGAPFFALQMDVISSSTRESMLQLHVFFGPYIYNLTELTITSGILEKNIFRLYLQYYFC